MIDDELATLIPYIISSDETRLSTMSGDKKAHPVYLSFGNIPKRLRRRISSHATVLIGYLPVAKLDIIANEGKRRSAKRALFHACLESLLAPLVAASKAGVEVPCYDGGIRCIYPALASYIADFPEQCKIACVKRTHCPTCTVDPYERGDLTDAPLRDHAETLQAMMEDRDTGSAKFIDLGLFEVRPFWSDHTLIDTGSLLTPDLLHQMNKGMFKDHLAKWVQSVQGKATMDERYVSMPEHHGVRHFKHGITSVSQWTGRELKEMTKIFLPVASDCDAGMLRVARVLLDFMYLAHSSSLTDDEIDAMDRALETFHENKADLVRLRAIEGGKFHTIPKLHMMQRYTHLIRRLGTPDGYNTETSERLHIDFAKSGYRASNRVNPLKQMALYIQRVEGIEMHLTYLMVTKPEAFRGAEGTAYSEDPDDDPDDDNDGLEDEEEEDEELEGLIQLPLVSFEEFASREGGGTWEREAREPGDGPDQLPIFYPAPEYKLSKKPTQQVTGDYLIKTHAANNLIPAVHSFLRKLRPGNRQICLSSRDVFPVWSRVRLIHAPPPFKPSEGPKLDVIRAQPAKTDRYGRVVRPVHFDTALVLKNPNCVGLHRMYLIFSSHWLANRWIIGYNACRVRAIFELPDTLRNMCSEKLVYVELPSGKYCS
jgi:hypothetical protein